MSEFQTVLYRWRVEAERYEDFQAAWQAMTDWLGQQPGSGGAQLFRGDDGLCYSLARWQSKQHRAQAFATLDGDAGARRLSLRMRAAVSERLEEVWLSPEPPAS